MDKVERIRIVEEFVQWLIESDLNSWENNYRAERNNWLDEKLREYKENFYKTR